MTDTGVSCTKCMPSSFPYPLAAGCVSIGLVLCRCTALLSTSLLYPVSVLIPVLSLRLEANRDCGAVIIYSGSTIHNTAISPTVGFFARCALLYLFHQPIVTTVVGRAGRRRVALPGGVGGGRLPVFRQGDQPVPNVGRPQQPTHQEHAGSATGGQNHPGGEHGRASKAPSWLCTLPCFVSTCSG